MRGNTDKHAVCIKYIINKFSVIYQGRLSIHIRIFSYRASLSYNEIFSNNTFYSQELINIYKFKTYIFR